MVDFATLDPELLQLQEVPSFAMKASPQLADELFSQWLSLPDTAKLVPVYSFSYFYLILFLTVSQCTLLFDSEIGPLVPSASVLGNFLFYPFYPSCVPLQNLNIL